MFTVIKFATRNYSIDDFLQKCSNFSTKSPTEVFFVSIPRFLTPWKSFHYISMSPNQPNLHKLAYLKPIPIKCFSTEFPTEVFLVSILRFFTPWKAFYKVLKSTDLLYLQTNTTVQPNYRHNCVWCLYPGFSPPGSRFTTF